MPTPLPTPDAPPRLRRSLASVTFVGALFGALLACLAEIGRMVGDRNKHVVVPGRVYRSAQLNPAQLEAFVKQYGIRTVVNLRGRPFGEWYPAQAQTTQALGVSQEDVTTSASRLPPSGEVRRLIEVFDKSEHPLLLHCQQGADRTGLAAAMYVLLYTDADYATARRQCSPRFGHLPVHTAATMDDFFDQYEDWLAARGEQHTPDRFRHWATAEYCPGPGRARMELLDPPTAVDVGKPFTFTVRAHNTSREAWQFMAGSRAGIHVQYSVQSMSGGTAVFAGDAGFLDAHVPPGGYIDLSLPVPAPAEAGRYLLLVDLYQRNVSFTQYGSEPLTYDWEARPPAPVRDR